MVGRYLAGSGQLLLSLAGAALILIWFATVLNAAYSIMESTGEPDLKHWVGVLGFGLLFLGWCWAWVSSLSILREVKNKQERRLDSLAKSPSQTAVPPRIQNK